MLFHQTWDDELDTSGSSEGNVADALVWDQGDASNSNDDQTSPSKLPQFKVKAKLNRRIVIWTSDIKKLRCDAFVRATDETLMTSFHKPYDLLVTGGSQLLADLAALKQCPTGEVRTTQAYGATGLCNYIIHAVPPIYSSKFHTAALSALHSVYKGILNASLQIGATTVAIPPLFVCPGVFPIEAACNLAVRALRRFLDLADSGFPEDFVVILLASPSLISNCATAINEEELAMRYREVLPIYFPRNESEMRLSVGLPEDDGFGAPLIHERRIPITAMSCRSSASCDGDYVLVEKPGEDELEDPSASVFTAAIGEMLPAPSDDNRLRRIRRQSHNSSWSSENKTNGSPLPSGRSTVSVSNIAARKATIAVTPESIKASMLSKAHKGDLSALVATGFLRDVGTDHLGRHIVVMLGRNVCLDKFDLMDQYLPYFLRVLDPIVSQHRKFIFIYCHSEAAQASSMLTLTQVSTLVEKLASVDERYISQLVGLFLLHLDWRSVLSVNLVARHFTLPTALSEKIQIFNCSQEIAALLCPLQTTTMKTDRRNLSEIDAIFPDFVQQYDLQDHKDHMVAGTASNSFTPAS